jgi:hypothetical protein
VVWVTVIVAVLGAPATAAVASPPAVDQYTQHLPQAGGGSTTADGGTPAARPQLLSKEAQRSLSGRDGQTLAQIATARDLGAPATEDSASDVTAPADNGFATVVADTALSAPGLVLLGALGGIALAGGWTRSTRGGRSSS